MPPLFSSLAAALLPKKQKKKPENDNHNQNSIETFDFPFTITSSSSATLGPSPSSSNDEERDKNVLVNSKQAKPQQKEQNVQPPAAGMAVAFSLFLLARCGSKATNESAPKLVHRLPIHFDLHSKDTVQAYHIYSEGEEEEENHSNSTENDTDELESMSKSMMKTMITSMNSSSTSNSMISTTANDYHDHLALASDLRVSKRHITIITTAAIPWMTGTSINPALRAIYLAKDGHFVTLVVPWVRNEQEQLKIFSKGSSTFKSRDEQDEYIQQWIRKQLKSNEKLNHDIDIVFYDGVYSEALGSIMTVGALTDFLKPLKVKDVCILEEPEHLTWHHSGKVWTEIFQFVVGIIHTNYIEYVKPQGFFGPHRALALLFLNMWVCRGYCHRVIKLSDAVQEYPNSITSNVHGVRDVFIDIGKKRRDVKFTRGAYFMGKVLWSKGYKDLIDLLIDHYDRNNNNQGGKTGTKNEEASNDNDMSMLPIDFFGGGTDSEEVLEKVNSEPALSRVHFNVGVADHTGDLLQSYKIFVNASRSDVVCTATAEALAMGKMVLCLKHPSNSFFETFENCYTYKSNEEFSELFVACINMEPKPLSERDAYRLTWEAATERLYDAMRLPLSKRRGSKVDGAFGVVHNLLSKIYPQPGNQIRKASEKQSQNEPNDEQQDELNEESQTSDQPAVSIT